MFAESEIIDLGNTNQRMKEIIEKMRDIMGKGDFFSLLSECAVLQRVFFFDYLVCSP